MKTKVSVRTLLICCILVFISTYTLLKLTNHETPNKIEPHAIDINSAVIKSRIKKYKLIQPLLYTDVYEESPSLKELRTKVNYYVDQVKKNQQAEDISVYFRKLNDGKW